MGGRNRYLGNAQIEVTLISKVLHPSGTASLCNVIFLKFDFESEIKYCLKLLSERISGDNLSVGIVKLVISYVTMELGLAAL